MTSSPVASVLASRATSTTATASASSAPASVNFTAACRVEGHASRVPRLPWEHINGWSGAGPRATGIRLSWDFAPPRKQPLQGRLSGLPDGVLVERDRIEVRFDGGKEAVARLYALAQALVNDYERFEELVGGSGIPRQRD